MHAPGPAPVLEVDLSMPRGRVPAGVLPWGCAAQHLHLIGTPESRAASASAPGPAHAHTQEAALLVGQLPFFPASQPKGGGGGLVLELTHTPGEHRNLCRPYMKVKASLQRGPLEAPIAPVACS